MMTPNIWTKSSQSGPWTDNCVEVCNSLDGNVLVRDTKDPDGGTQHYTRAEWRAFVEGVKLGEFDA